MKAPIDMKWLIGERRTIEGIEVLWPAEGLIATLIGGVKDTRMLVVEAPDGSGSEIEVIDAPGEDVDGALLRALPPKDIQTAIAKATEHLSWKRPLPGRELERSLLRTPEQARAWRLCRLEYFELCRTHGTPPPSAILQEHRRRWPRERVGSSPPAQGSLVSTATPWLDGLNDEQRAAVLAPQGPLLVLSGPGTGKTRVLAARLAHVIKCGLAHPTECLAATFTTRAAHEMRERLRGMIGSDAAGVLMGTFHSLCLRILSRHPEAGGLKPGFAVLDGARQTKELIAAMREAGFDPKSLPPAEAMSAIQRVKNRAGDLDRDIEDVRFRAIAQAYQSRLSALNACDFGDLTPRALDVFRSEPGTLALWRRAIRHLHVDEYQDANHAQHLWLEKLAGPERNLCCIGDDDQSIYAWRGAESGIVQRFGIDNPDATIVRLERNYRSTPRIAEAASALIARNAGRMDKALRATGDPGDRIRIRAVADNDAETLMVGEEIKALMDRGEDPSGMAILVRVGFLIPGFVESLAEAGVPVRLMRPQPLADLPEDDVEIDPVAAEGSGVSIMTLHAAKGLEFDTVFLPGWEEDILPHQAALMERGTRGEEEERRLAYVGLTRARKRAVISFAAERRIQNLWLTRHPSRFIDEIPRSLSERSSEDGLRRGLSAFGSDWGDLA